MITLDKISVDDSDSEFITVNYIQIDDGIDMGGRLCVERASLSTIFDILNRILNEYGQGKVEINAGNDSFRFYESGPDQQPIYNILNRRPEGIPNNGISGLMMTKSAAEDLIKQISHIIGETYTVEAMEVPSSNQGLDEADEVSSLNQSLVEAVESNDLNALRDALNRGADVNFLSQYKQSALHIAAERGRFYAVALLLSAGVAIENRDVADKTPLMAAAFAGQTKVVKLLLQYGAVINRDLLDTLQLKVNIFTENSQPETAQAWQSFLFFLIEKWNEQKK